jgi:hypothetical protein
VPPRAKLRTPNLTSAVLRRSEFFWLQTPIPRVDVRGSFSLEAFTWARLQWCAFTVTLIGSGVAPFVCFGAPALNAGPHYPSSAPLPVGATLRIQFQPDRAFPTTDLTGTMQVFAAPSLWTFKPVSIDWGAEPLGGGEQIGALTGLLEVIR